MQAVFILQLSKCAIRENYKEVEFLQMESAEALANQTIS